MTGEGTNTYLYRRPAATDSEAGVRSIDAGAGPADAGAGSSCVVIDPGVDDAGHLAAIEGAAEALGAAIEAVLISHDHPDHIGGAERLGVPVLHPADGEVRGGLRALATPGHADDHLCFVTVDGDVSQGGDAALGERGPVLFSADLILGEGSTFVQPGGGSLIAYLDSLRRVRDLAPALICPGHGPWITDPLAKVDEYIEHRMMRERNLVAALERGLRGRDALIDEVWADAPPELREITALVLRAHLEKLEIESRLPPGESPADILTP